ncbi:MAG: GntR family transcriptional regulator [Lachnospiraceae bacterium]|nr:GntR family transcriptional regulator [Lachnospiraceae bacterium]MDE6627696.1 GntR family transcriptional regulator [Lachnospiraceae bacterium]
MEIDESSLTPIFMQVAGWLEEEILKDHIMEEEQVPSTNQFAAMYKINPATARKGFALLTDEGILYKKRGIGMFVASGAKEKIKKKAKERFINESLVSLLEEAGKLNITKQDLIEMINQLGENSEE